ncbi:MAG TPA: hypothetical protein VF017_06025 [Thermoanaerobaculia bacterium]|nr:hypothetical protein [Thermoanaerobaculia bacterium]
MSKPSGGARRAGQGGRPALAPEEVKSHWLAFRVTANQLERVRGFAGEWKVSLSDYLRRRALQAPAPRPPLPLPSLALLQETRRIGNNLNQLQVAIHSNRVDLALLPEVEAIGRALRSIERALLSPPARIQSE